MGRFRPRLWLWEGGSLPPPPAPNLGAFKIIKMGPSKSGPSESEAISGRSERTHTHFFFSLGIALRESPVRACFSCPFLKSSPGPRLEAAGQCHGGLLCEAGAQWRPGDSFGSIPFPTSVSPKPLPAYWDISSHPKKARVLLGIYPNVYALGWFGGWTPAWMGWSRFHVGQRRFRKVHPFFSPLRSFDLPKLPLQFDPWPANRSARQMDPKIPGLEAFTLRRKFSTTMRQGELCCPVVFLLLFFCF